MTDKAIQARAELKAWIEKYKPEGDIDDSGCYYPEDKTSANISVDGTVILNVDAYGNLMIQGE